VNLGELKSGAVGRGFLTFGKRFMGLKNTSKESLCEKLR